MSLHDTLGFAFFKVKFTFSNQQLKRKHISLVHGAPTGAECGHRDGNRQSFPDIESTVEAINAGLQSLKSGAGTLGKVAVIVDRDLAEAS